MRLVNKVHVHCQTAARGYYLLSVYNFNLNAFPSLFPGSVINKLSMYWLDAEKDFVSSLKYPIPITELNFVFDGFDIQILTLEVELDNDFLIDTNLSDELFCRVTPDYPVQDLIDKIKVTQQNLSKILDNQRTLSSLSQDQWITRPLE